MTELDLYKFIKEYNIEYSWNMNGEKKDVYMFVDFWQIKYFHKILTETIFDDDGLSCTMKDGYITFEMDDICEYYDIELEKVFEKTDKDKRMLGE